MQRRGWGGRAGGSPGDRCPTTRVGDSGGGPEGAGSQIRKQQVTLVLRRLSASNDRDSEPSRWAELRTWGRGRASVRKGSHLERE